MFMSFVGRCWDTSKTSHGIWTWVGQVATRLQDFEAQITAQPPWQDRFFHGIWGSDVLGYLWLFQGSPSWWNGVNWTLIWVDMCWDASFPMLIMHMNIDIDPKGNEDVFYIIVFRLYHGSSIDLAYYCHVFEHVFRCGLTSWISGKTSWRLACRSQAHSILQEHITLARNLFVNPQAIIRHLSWPDSINWAFLDFVKSPIILTQLHSTWHSTPSTQVIQCLHGLWQEVVTCSSLDWNDQAHWRRGTGYRPRHHGRGETTRGGVVGGWRPWKGHISYIIKVHLVLGTALISEVVLNCSAGMAQHIDFCPFIFRLLEGGASFNPINIAKPHRINQKHLFDQQLPCKSQSRQVPQDVDQLKFDVGELKDLLTNSKGLFAAPCEVSQCCHLHHEHTIGYTVVITGLANKPLVSSSKCYIFYMQPPHMWVSNVFQ